MGSELSFRNIPLGQCLNKVIDHRGKTPKKLGSDWVESGIQTISAKNVNGGRLVARDAIRCVASDVYKRWMNTGDVLRGDCLLVSEGATMGECMYWDEDPPVVIGQRLFGLRCNPDILNSRYLYAYMVSHEFQSEIVGRSTGTSVPGLRQTEVLKLNVRLPSLARQKFIGDTLYTLNRKIELNRWMNVTLESMARALFKSWFVDFDPVIDNALAAGNPIPEPLSARAQTRRDLGTKRKPLPKNIQKLFPDAFAFDEDLGWMPEGWNQSTIGEHVAIKHGYAFKGEYFQKEKTRDVLLTPGNFDIGGGFKGDKLKYYDGPVEDDYVLSVNDMVVTMTDLSKAGDTLGYPAFVPASQTYRFLHNQRLGRVFIEPESHVGSHFVYQTFCRHRYRKHVLATATGSTVKHSSPDRIRAFEIVVGSAEVHAAFEESVSPTADRVSQSELASLTLAKLRDTLLPKLLSGELRIPDAEKLVAGSL